MGAISGMDRQIESRGINRKANWLSLLRVMFECINME